MMTPPIRREWVLSVAAGRLFLLSGLASLALFIFLVALAFTQALFGPLPDDLAVKLFIMFFFVVGAFGLAVLWVGMWLCLLNFEKETFAGAIFALMFVLLGPLGCVIYYFARYRGLLDRELDPPKAAAVSA